MEIYIHWETLRVNKMNMQFHRQTSVSAGLNCPKKSFLIRRPSNRTITNAWMYKTCKKTFSLLKFGWILWCIKLDSAGIWRELYHFTIKPRQ